MFSPSLASVWHKRLPRATLDMHGMQENVRHSNLQLVFCRLFHLIKGGICQE